MAVNFFNKDMKNTFLNEELKEGIYVQQPTGFEKIGEKKRYTS